MARRPRTKPRKTASQARSRATVDALVEATARILVEEGFDKASTNRIAERAGVSIGSLYQYFPGKEALVAAVMDRHQQQILQTVRGRLAGVFEQPLARAMRTLVTLAVEAHRVDPALHRVLAEQTPRVGELAARAAFDPANYTLFKACLQRYRDELVVTDLELASFVCVTAIEALSHNAVLHHPGMLQDEAMEALIDACTRLLVGYLGGVVAPGNG